MSALAKLVVGTLLCVCVGCSGLPGRPASPSQNDPHTTPAGFFDMHVCNWPERPFFFKSIFSTTRYAQIRDIEVFTPDGTPLVHFSLTNYKTVNKPGKPVKRVYIADVPVPSNAQSGWYTARIRTTDGHRYTARDHLEIRRMDQVLGGIHPSTGSLQTQPPRELSWSPVAGAHHYLVYVHDRWDGDRLIYASPPLTEPRLVLPSGLIQPGGAYLWRVNARDRKEDPEYGDFNHGSLSPFFAFDVQDPS